MKKRTPLIPGLSRREIAERLGLKPRTIAGIEQGRDPLTERNRRAVEVIKAEGPAKE